MDTIVMPRVQKETVLTINLELGWHWFVMLAGAGTASIGGTVSNRPTYVLLIDDNQGDADLVRLRLVEGNSDLKVSYPGSAVESLMSSCHPSLAEQCWQGLLSLVPGINRETEIAVGESFPTASDQPSHSQSFGRLVVGREAAGSCPDSLAQNDRPCSRRATILADQQLAYQFLIDVHEPGLEKGGTLVLCLEANKKLSTSRCPELAGGRPALPEFSAHFPTANAHAPE
jgi:hypothetical protein